MKFIQVILEIATGNRIADPHRYYGQLVAASMRDFPSNMGRFVRMIGEDEHHHAAGLDSSHDDQPSPGLMSLGAIQQRTPADSSLLQAAYEISLSWLEWLMNTSYGIVHHRSLLG